MNPTHILANAFIDRLIESGIVPEHTTHVVIDAKAGDVTKLHYSAHVMDDDLLEALAPKVTEVRVRGQL